MVSRMNMLRDMRAFLFDLDGTLLDTREFIFQAAEHSLRQFGHAIPPRERIARAVGIPLEGFYRTLIGDERADVSAIATAHHEFQKENLALSVPFSGVLETLELLHRSGVKLAAVTNRRSGTAVPTLEKAGLLGLLDPIICADDVVNPKPDAEPVLAALMKMRETPGRAVMVGDSSIDVEAGRNAGTKTVRVTYGFHADDLHDPEPDVIIRDFRDLRKLL
jgi:pyrophosphatase PpaX